MGSKTVVQGSSTSTQTATPTAEETRLNQLQIQDLEASQGQRQGVNSAGLDLAKLLLTGQNLPGYLGTLPGGISEDVIQGNVDKSLRDLNTQLAASGAGTYLESGASQAMGVRTAGDLRTQASQFNLQNLQQLLNLAVGGQAVPLQYSSDIGNQLGSRLAGLRTINQTGTSSQTTRTPFLQTQFAGGIGQGMGSAFGTALAGCWVASEIFGGWFEPKTISSRIFINLKAPKWLRNLYMANGESVARFISDKPIMKLILRPIFELFAYLGGHNAK